MSISRVLRLLPPRLAAFFRRGLELQFHSGASQHELMERFKHGLRSRGWGAHGAAGYVRGDGIHMHWATGLFRDSFAPVFHGRVEATATGSTVRGRMAHNRLVQVFMAFWCSGLIVISILSLWTVIMPLAGYALLWAVNGMMAIGDHLHPGRDQRIRDFIQSTCDASPP